MEAVAAAASIAGIITVVGQSIDGLIKFTDFFSDISSASKTISRLLDDINSLIRVLEDIGNVLERARARRRYQINLACLDIKLEDCAKDVQIWLATARLLRPGGSDGGGKAWLRKFRLAVKNTAIQTIREEIGKHKQTLSLSLAVFGRYVGCFFSTGSYPSLGIYCKFRTIDIDTSDQVHQIGGQFNEALSTSLSVHGAYEEALKRIEHYSMTSMHSSAHSIRSMDSIRTELSRLEAMINSTSRTHHSEMENGDSRARRGSNCTAERSSAVEGGNPGPNLSIQVPLHEHSGESTNVRHPRFKHAPRQSPLAGTRNTIDYSSQSQRTREMTVEHRIQPDDRRPSVDYHSSLQRPDDIDDQYVEDPSEEGNTSSILYAEFSKQSQPRQLESSEVGIDCGAIHGTLRQSLATLYPREVVEYISLRQVTTLCEGHIDLLDKRPGIHMSNSGKMKRKAPVDDASLTPARLSMIALKNRLIELRSAIRVSREQCIQAGYSLSELDKLLSPPGSGSSAPTDRLPLKSQRDSGDDSSSAYSEDFYSPTE